MVQEDKVRVYILDLQGRKLFDIYTGSLSVGENVIPWDGINSLSKGNYFIGVNFNNNTNTIQKLLIK